MAARRTLAGMSLNRSEVAGEGGFGELHLWGRHTAEHGSVVWSQPSTPRYSSETGASSGSSGVHRAYPPSPVPRPLITVVIPVRDRVELLERSVRSVLEQSVIAVEIVVVDDGSSDDIASAVEAFGDARLRYVRQDPSGPAAARNRGVLAGTAPVVTFLDSDDRARPEWLARLLSLLGDQTCGLASVAGEWCDPAGGRTIVGPVTVLSGAPVVAYLAGLFAVRRPLFDAVGGYDPALLFGENRDLVTRLVETCGREGLRVATSDEPLIEILETSRLDRYDVARLEAAEHLLVRDAERLRAQPAERAQIAAIASVNAMRLGRSTQARSTCTDGPPGGADSSAALRASSGCLPRIRARAPDDSGTASIGPLTGRRARAGQMTPSRSRPSTDHDDR